MADSVPLTAFEPDGSEKGAAAGPEASAPRLRVGNVKLIIALFIIFLTVVSETFTNSIISGFGEKAVRGRSPTAWGVVLQGIFLVIFYILAIYLTEHGIL